METIRKSVGFLCCAISFAPMATDLGIACDLMGTILRR